MPSSPTSPSNVAPIVTPIVDPIDGASTVVDLGDGAGRAVIAGSVSDPLAVLARVFSTGWEAFATPTAHPALDAARGVVQLGVTVVRNGHTVDLARDFPLGDAMPTGSVVTLMAPIAARLRTGATGA